MMIDLPLFIWATQFWVLTGSQRTENQRTQQLFFRNSAEPAAFLHVLLPDTHLTFPQKSSRTCRLNPICLPTNTLLPTQTHTQTHTHSHTHLHTHTHTHTHRFSLSNRGCENGRSQQNFLTRYTLKSLHIFQDVLHPVYGVSWAVSLKVRLGRECEQLCFWRENTRTESTFQNHGFCWQ